MFCSPVVVIVVSGNELPLSAAEVELWSTFKQETLQAAKECIGEHLRSRSGFALVETLGNIEWHYAASLQGTRTHTGHCHVGLELSSRDKERYVSDLAEEVKCHLNANDC